MPGDPGLPGSSELHGPGPLVELSAAFGSYDPRTESPQPPSRRPSVVISMVVGLLIGFAIAASSPLQYRGVATFRYADGVEPARKTAIQKELAHFASHTIPPPRENPSEWEWTVDASHPRYLGLSVTGVHRSELLPEVRRRADAFLRMMGQQRIDARRQPTEVETILARTSQRLRTMLRESQSRLQAATERAGAHVLPAASPELMDRWERRREAFQRLRKKWVVAKQAFTDLESQPDPSQGLVSDTDRRRALAEDRALRQDLAELSVNLAELRRSLVQTLPQADSRLERLISAAGVFEDTLKDSPVEPGADGSAILTVLGRRLSEFRERVETFSRAWAVESAALRELRIDPLRAETLERFQRLRGLLGDYFYVGAKLLTALRGAIGRLSEDQTHAARHHVLHSRLIRSFHELQTAHHRFEFAAAAIEPRENFRIDAALQAARGLHRRTESRLAAIERQLEQTALQRAREERIRSLETTRGELMTLRKAMDRQVEELLAVQEQLNQSAEQNIAMAHATTDVRVANERVELLEDRVESAEQTLVDLEAKRLGADPAIGITLSRCEILPRPVNLKERARAGILGGVLGAVALLLGQWWVARKPSSAGRASH